MQHNDIAIISDMRVEKVQKHNCKRCGYERRLPRTTISLFFVNIVPRWPWWLTSYRRFIMR